MLYNTVKAYRRANGTGLTVLEPEVIYPINWLSTVWAHEQSIADNEIVVCDPLNRHFSATSCKKRFPNSYAITYWAHSWGKQRKRL